nr:suppressor protein SRP40 [Ipomoea batatas]
MPSGAKKRKAAKKKKGLQVQGAPHLPNSTLPHSNGEEDLEHQNDKDSDGGDVSSPASQDNHTCHELIDREEEEVDKKEDGSLDQSSIHEHKSDEMTNGGGEMEKGTMEEESGVHVEEVDKQEDGSLDQSSIHEHKSDGMTNGGEEMEKGTIEEESALHLEREFEVEDVPQSKDINIECTEAPKESNEGRLFRSLSSSSDSEDGSTAARKNKIVVDDTPAVDLVKEVDSLSADKVNDVGTVFTPDLDKAAMSENEVQVEKCVLDGSGLKGNEDKKMGIVEENASVSEGVAKMDMGKMEGEAVQTSHDNDAEALDAAHFATRVNGEKVTQLHDVPKVCASIGDEGVGEKADEVIQISHANDVKASEPKDYATMEKSDTLTLSYNAPIIDESIGDDPVKDSELSECSYNQHQAGSALRSVQTTSWKGCCGLFELFAGSNR